METSSQSLPGKADHSETTRITTTLYNLIEAIGDVTTTQEEYLIYLTVDNLIRGGRLKWIDH